MTEQAIMKINTEMQKDPNNTYLEIIGHYVIDRCADEAVAASVMAENKNLSGAASAVRSAAQKNQKGSCGVLKDSEVFDAIDLYFGLARDENARNESIRQVDGERQTAPSVKKAAPGAIKLDLESFF